MADDGDAGVNATEVERRSERELVVTRTLHAPARTVWEAWTRSDLFGRWWLPASFSLTLVSHEADVRTGGSYRLAIGHPSSPKPMLFFGRYLEVTPPSRLAWTNEEGEGEGPVTTVTLKDQGDTTVVVVSDLFASAQALDEAIESGSTSGWQEQFEQLDHVLATLPRDGGD